MTAEHTHSSRVGPALRLPSASRPPGALFSWVCSGRIEKAEKRSVYRSPHSH